jgi:hypothetical protein
LRRFGGGIRDTYIYLQGLGDSLVFDRINPN